MLHPCAPCCVSQWNRTYVALPAALMSVNVLMAWLSMWRYDEGMPRSSNKQMTCTETSVNFRQHSKIPL